MKLLKSKGTALTVAVVIFGLAFVPAIIFTGFAGIQAARLVDELPAPAFGSPVSADLDAHYAVLLGGAITAVVALIASVTLIVTALNSHTVANADGGTKSTPTRHR